MTDDEKPSPGKLFIDAFLDKNLVDFGECREHYERMTPDELVDEIGFLFSKPVMSIPFGFSGKRYYAFFVSLVHCAANSQDMANGERAKLVNMAIELLDYIRGKTAEGERKKLDDAISATFDKVKRLGLYPLVGDLIAEGVRDHTGGFPVNPVGEVMSKREDTFVVPHHLAINLIFDEGPQGAETVSAYLRATGESQILEDYGAHLMKQSVVVSDGGKIDLRKLTAWENRYSGALSMLPGLQSKLDAIRKAITDRDAELDRFRRSAAQLFIDHDPATATKKLFALPDTISAMRSLVEMMGSNQPAIEGLRKAVVDYISDEVGVTNDRAHEYLAFLAKHDQALAILFDATKMQTLRDIAADLERTQFPRNVAPAVHEAITPGIVGFLRNLRRKKPKDE